MTNTYAQGRVDDIRESGWTCSDCGNQYDATVDACPNTLLDGALSDTQVNEFAGPTQSYGYLAPERTEDGKAIVVGPFRSRKEAEAQAGGHPIVTMSNAPDEFEARRTRDDRHLVNCPCEYGSCCSWIEDCNCQCLCDFIALIEERVRSEFVPPGEPIRDQ